jgi:hypothetical protein
MKYPSHCEEKAEFDVFPAVGIIRDLCIWGRHKKGF